MTWLRKSRFTLPLACIGKCGFAAVALLFAQPTDSARAASGQAKFDQPDMAVDALLENLKNRDVDGLAKLFGQEQWDELVGPDKSQAREGLLRIYEAPRCLR
jgi:hypothetical protein